MARRLRACGAAAAGAGAASPSAAGSSATGAAAAAAAAAALRGRPRLGVAGASAAGASASGAAAAGAAAAALRRPRRRAGGSAAAAASATGAFHAATASLPSSLAFAVSRASAVSIASSRAWVVSVSCRHTVKRERRGVGEALARCDLMCPAQQPTRAGPRCPSWASPAEGEPARAALGRAVQGLGSPATLGMPQGTSATNWGACRQAARRARAARGEGPWPATNLLLHSPVERL